MGVRSQRDVGFSDQDSAAACTEQTGWWAEPNIRRGDAAAGSGGASGV